MGWGVLVLVAIGLLTAGAPSTMPPGATAVASGDEQPTVAPFAGAGCPLDDDDSRDVDGDDDSDDDASLTVAVALPLPVLQRVAYRAATATSYAPPDSDEPLRPPQLGID